MDWFEIFMLVATAAAALGYVVLEQRVAKDHGERIARLEAAVVDGHTEELLQRVTALETRMDYKPAKRPVRRPDGRFAKKE